MSTAPRGSKCWGVAQRKKPQWSLAPRVLPQQRNHFPALGAVLQTRRRAGARPAAVSRHAQRGKLASAQAKALQSRLRHDQKSLLVFGPGLRTRASFSAGAVQLWVALSAGGGSGGSSSAFRFFWRGFALALSVPTAQSGASPQHRSHQNVTRSAHVPSLRIETRDAHVPHLGVFPNKKGFAF